MLHLKPEMASLTTGSVNFAKIIYENHPTLINDLAASMLANDIKPEVEIFDLAMLYNAAKLVADGLLKAPVHVQFVLGIPGALPADREVLEFELEQLERVLPGATWTAAGIGRHQLTVNEWTLELGGHCRTGLEDNLRFDKERLAASNAELVQRVAEPDGQVRPLGCDAGRGAPHSRRCASGSLQSLHNNEEGACDGARVSSRFCWRCSSTSSWPRSLAARVRSTASSRRR